LSLAVAQALPGKSYLVKIYGDDILPFFLSSYDSSQIYARVNRLCGVSAGFWSLNLTYKHFSYYGGKSSGKV
jgi:hypothetical protein